MSVLVKGMKMPKNCFECRFFRDDGTVQDWSCALTNIDITVDENGKALECPCTEIDDSDLK